MADHKKPETGPRKIAIRRGITPDPPGPELFEPRGRKKAVFLTARKRRIPPWLLAVLVFVLIMAGLFFVVPRISERTPDFDVPVLPEETLPPGWDDYLSAPDTAVVKTAAAPLFSAPDPASTRLAEAVLNERVTLLDTGGREWIQVRLDDGVTGYMNRDRLSADTESISPKQAVARVIVRVPFKRIMSHARSGSLVVEAPMGTVLYADYRNGDLLRVRLPDRQKGWINATGVMLVPPLAAITPEDRDPLLLVATMMTFDNSPLIPGGITSRGISPEGALRIAGLVNGLNLPRDRYRLLESGQAVELPLDEEGRPDLALTREGDVIFFHKPQEPEAIGSMAMRVTDGQVLIALPGRTTFRLLDIESAELEKLTLQFMAVRRYLADDE